ARSRAHASYLGAGDTFRCLNKGRIAALDFSVIKQLLDGSRGSDLQPRLRAECDALQISYIFDVDQAFRSNYFILHQGKQIGAAGKPLSFIPIVAQEFDRLLPRSWTGVFKCAHCCLPSWLGPQAPDRELEASKAPEHLWHLPLHWRWPRPARQQEARPIR